MGSAERTSHDAITQMLIQAPSATMERIRGRIASLFGVANIGRVMLREGSGGELVMEIHVKPGELIAMMRSDQAEEGAADPEALRQAVDLAIPHKYFSGGKWVRRRWTCAGGFFVTGDVLTSM